MAKTIGRDKGSTTRAPLSAEPDAASTPDTSGDEDMRDDDTDESVVAEDAAGELEADEDTGDERDLVVAPARALNRVPSTSVARRGFRVPKVFRPLVANPVGSYIASSIDELTKVTAPTPQEAWNMTLIVMLMAGVVAAILGVADIALIRALSWIVGLSTPGSGSPTH